MSKLKILAGPDRLAFVNSQFAEIDSVPVPGYLSRPQSRGGDVPPTYRGEVFLIKAENDNDRRLPLIITGMKRKGRSGLIQEFTAVLWAACDEFRDFLFGDPTACWVEFKGEFDFTTQNGWLEQVQP
jgi:hypothetical protein